jgi:hypothetical protein
MSFTCTAHLIIHQWDKEVDGKIVRVKLPKKMKVEVTAEDDGNATIEEIHEAAMDAASDKTGFCILGCSIARIDFQK